MNIAIIAYPGKYTIAPSLKAVLSWCRESGTGCYAIRSLFAVAEMKAEGVLHAVETDLQALEQADVVVTIGGDGTMLHTAQQIRRFDLPVLGINSGRLGFMANVQHNQIGAALETVSRGEYRLDERFMLEATINGGDRKSTRLNSSHVAISYAVFCLKKKKKIKKKIQTKIQ